MAVMAIKPDASRKSGANNKASTDSFFVCRAHCTYKARMPIELLIAPLSSSNLIPTRMRTIIVSFAIAPLVAYILWKLHARRARNISTVQHKFSDPKACKEILDCTGYASGDRNTINPVESRANPNQRLVRAFDIDNAFTTKDDEYRISFTREARGKLSALKKADWKRIAGHADALLQYGLARKQCCLDSLVRSMSLKITLHTLFKLDPMHMDDESIEKITSSINDLWVESKISVEPSAPTKKKLRQALARFFPNTEFSGPGNPLNFILPAYETLWRVVLSGFIEVAFREGALPDWRLELVRFIEDPTGDKLKFASCDKSIPVEFIIKEALRLYPSTKSVYREFRMETKRATDIVIADIEKCHRIPSLWGINPDTFDPSRWKDLKAEAKKAFMPFGYLKFTCPAKHVYGPMMIAVLVAVLAKHITAEKWTLELYCAGSETGHELRGNDALKADRKTYEKMMIRNKETT